ncbi:MAG: glutathione S-transferase family protein [SAR324 cluster bacterium]|nr:glutathione S-transferase family protein [SAR324 cluster bacterium]
MGMLIEGQWVEDPPRRNDASGRFMRAETVFRNRVTADGSSGCKAEAGRFHLYVSLACPWAHRTLILRKLKRLEDAISLSVVDHFMGDDGWHFSDNPGAVPDTVNGKRLLSEVYLAADAAYTGRVSVPVLWDKQQGTVVNNESREIMRMLDLEFDAVGGGSVTFCPPSLRRQVDETIDAIYQPINNGVYRSGFAGSQEAYEEAVGELFDALDHWESVLDKQRYLAGDVITEADWCMFTTLVRFDLVYHTHFKCNLRRIIDYPNLWNYLRELFQVPGVAETCNFEHIKRHYFESHRSINPLGIVPLGPGNVDFNAPHDRERKFSS